MIGYDEYKTCSQGWIGEFPSHWQHMPLRYTAVGKGCSFIDGDWIESKNISSDGIKYLTTGNVGPGYYKEQGAGFITEDTFKELDCTDVLPGDLLISRLNEPIARTCIVPDLGTRVVTAVDNVIFRPNPGILDRRFACYYLNNNRLTEHANIIARGATMHRISRSMLGHITVLLPPIDEQVAIADYLDAECKKIDGLIAKEEKRVELLSELKQTIISKAITKGIDKNTLTKESGIDWVGKIPNDWAIWKTSHLFSGIGSGTTPKSGDANYYDENGFNWLQTGDLNDGHITVTSKKVTDLAVKEKNLRFYPINSIVIAMYGATIGKVGLLDIETSTNQACCVFPPSRKILPEFVFYHFIAAKPALVALSAGGGQPNISQDIIRRHRIPIPASLDEQRRTVSYIINETSVYDKTIAKANRQIDLLKEYKQSLITEVVTGKRKVC